MSVFQLVLQDSTLKVVMDYLIKGIQRCQTWARPDILKALAAVVYENCDKIQQVCMFEPERSLWSYHYGNLSFGIYSGLKVTFSSCSIY